jgi:anti-sigma factor RsiW
MFEAEEWRKRIAELRQLAERTEDAERHQRLLELAEQWEQFAKEVGKNDS